VARGSEKVVGESSSASSEHTTMLGNADVVVSAHEVKVIEDASDRMMIACVCGKGLSVGRLAACDQEGNEQVVGVLNGQKEVNNNFLDRLRHLSNRDHNSSVGHGPKEHRDCYVGTGWMDSWMTQKAVGFRSRVRGILRRSVGHGIKSVMPSFVLVHKGCVISPERVTRFLNDEKSGPFLEGNRGCHKMMN
jgi:hypothetical protein